MVYCRGAFPAPNCWEGLLRGGRLRTGLDGRRSGSRIRGQAGKAAAAFAVGQGRAGGLEEGCDVCYVCWRRRIPTPSTHCCDFGHVML